jgi:hypothetical protein
MNHHSEIVSKGEAQCLKMLWKELKRIAEEQERSTTEDNLRSILNTDEGQSVFRQLAQQVGAARAWWLVTRFPLDCVLENDFQTGEKTISRMDMLPEQIEIWMGVKHGSDFALKRLEPPMDVNKDMLIFEHDPFTLFEETGRWWTEDAGLQAEYTLPFTEEAELNTIEVIMAVGLGSASPRKLFEDHRNAGRLSLLPLDAPTNTISGEPAADLAQDAEVWWRLLSYPGEPTTRKDIALAIAGDPEALNAIPGGTRGHRALNEDLMKLTWPALWGHTLKDIWCVDSALGWTGFSFELGLWAHEFLHPEGPLAPVRIGDLPYGVWPVSRLNDNAWQVTPNDRWLKQEVWLSHWLPKARKQWAAGTLNHSGTVKGADTEKFVNLLGRVPSSSEYGFRTFLPIQMMYVLAASLSGNGHLENASVWSEKVEERAQAAYQTLDFGAKPIRHYMTSGWRQDMTLPLVEPSPATGPVSGVDAGWTHIVSSNQYGLFFYNAFESKYTTGRLSKQGHYQYKSTSRFERQFAKIVGSASGGLLFYNEGTGEAATAQLKSDGSYSFARNISNIAAGWTHIVSAGASGLLFYNESNGKGATGLLDGTGRFTRVADVRGTFSNWTRITGTKAGGLLFYNTYTGRSATARLDNQGNYSGGAEIISIGRWTHIVSANEAGLLLYNELTGEGETAKLDENGGYQRVAPVHGLAKGWTHIVGSPSGGIFFYNENTGEAATARLNSSGYYEQDEGSRFLAHLERIFELDEHPDLRLPNLFSRPSELCKPLIDSDSLLIRLLLNSLALLYGEMGRMREQPDSVGLPLIERFNPDMCTDLEMWSQAVALRFTEFFENDRVIEVLSPSIEPDDMPLLGILRNLIETLSGWRIWFSSYGADEVKQRLSDIERAFRAILDTAAIRIDPWITGMAWRRLKKLREEGKPDALGLYAWVDRPYTGTPGPTAGGTLLAPSHAQLLTSLIMRDKHINDFEAKRWKIDLDSRKVRMAQRLADEVRGGAHIQEILGRAVEDIIGEKDLIGQMRKKFKIREEHAGRRVCDGQRVLSEEGKTFLDGLNLSVGQETALEELRQVTDTYGDLLVANAVHAIVEGRPEKAGETMNAAAGLELPPEFDLLRTPHSGQSVNTTVWMALPFKPQPTASDLNVSPALLSDASVANWLEQAVPASEWQWLVQRGDEQLTVSLNELGLSISETLAYDENALNAFAISYVNGDKISPTSLSPALSANHKLRRLTTLLNGQVRDIYNVPEDYDLTLWENHNTELWTRLQTLLLVAESLSAALSADDADESILLIAKRWGISPPPLDDTLTPNEYRLTDSDQLKHQIAQAHEVIQERIERIKLLELFDTKTPLHQVVQAITELSGIKMPIYGRVEQPALEDFGELKPNAGLDRTWLETVAAVRPALARVEAHQLGADLRLHAWCNEDNPWRSVEDEAEMLVKQPMNVVVCYGPDGTLGSPHYQRPMLAVVVLDSWSEMIPSKRRVVEAAFGFNAPSSRAPQAILLAVPPDEAKPLDTETLAHIVLEARESAHARMATPEDIEDFAALFPFAMLASQQPTGVGMKPVDPFHP